MLLCRSGARTRISSYYSEHFSSPFPCAQFLGFSQRPAQRIACEAQQNFLLSDSRYLENRIEIYTMIFVLVGCRNVSGAAEAWW
ncbi:hypothetical protein E2C01_088117 [Portunus trituberculatus]|uniref:Uncharacterized protein n=1 Tax=Portunus trituberculatus TaxID=210409 RepID=A0A5B7J9X1_PORTR|nr:hypothetical protein [Portunus trituberculatus]